MKLEIICKGAGGVEATREGPRFSGEDCEAVSKAFSFGALIGWLYSSRMPADGQAKIYAVRFLRLAASCCVRMRWASSPQGGGSRRGVRGTDLAVQTSVL